MQKLWFRLAVRRITGSPFSSLIIISCLVAGLTPVLFIVFWLKDEINYDKFHEKAERIYRLTIEKNDPEAGYYSHFARSWYGWLKHSKEEIPGIEDIARLTAFGNGIVNIENENVFDASVYQTEPSLFRTLTFEVLHGKRNELLIEPGTAVLSKSAALRYFGKEDPVGETIQVYCRNCIERTEYKIISIVKDFPDNSHFHFEVLIPYPNPEEYNGWAYYYLLLENDTKPSGIIHGFKRFALNHTSKEEAGKITPWLQNITDIHLSSHKARELEINGNRKNIFYFSILGLIVFIVSILNFINLLHVKISRDIKNLKICIYQGAGYRNLFFQYVVYLLSLILTGVFISLVIFEVSIPWFNTLMHKFPGAGREISHHISLLVIPVLATLLFLAGLVPFFGSVFLLKRSFSSMNHTGSDYFIQKRQVRLSRLLIIFQFTASVFLIIASIVVNRQATLLHGNSLGAGNENLLVIRNVPVQVYDNYLIFRENLLQNSKIFDVTSTFEDPGDETMDMMNFETSDVKDDISNKLLNVYPVDDNFFHFYNIEFIAGRNFSDADFLNKEGEDYILNESAVRYLGWKPEDAIGRKFSLRFFINDSNLFRGGHVVGVVKDFQPSSMKGTIKSYVFFQKPFWLFSIQVKADSLDLQETIQFMKSNWNSCFPGYPFIYTFIDDIYHEIYRNEIQLGKLGSILGVLALILSCSGLIGITGLVYERQKKEVGIRKISGATTGKLMISNISKMLIMVLIAWVIAIPAAFFILREWLQHFAFPVILHWGMFFFPGLVVTGIAIASVAWQTWKTTSGSPVKALRHE